MRNSKPAPCPHSANGRSCARKELENQVVNQLCKKLQSKCALTPSSRARLMLPPRTWKKLKASSALDLSM